MSQTPKKGDRISVTIEGIVSNEVNPSSNRGLYVIIGGPDETSKVYIGRSSDAARTLKILPRDLKVGDLVNPPGFNTKAVVVAIAEGQALIKWLTNNTYSNYSVASLNLAEEGCDC